MHRDRLFRDRFRSAGPVGLVLLTALAATACSDSAQPAAALPGDHPLARVEFPLFEDFEEGCRQLMAERVRAGAGETVLSDEVDWAATLDEAFERAAREDKPVMIATFVRENGDPHCDV